MIIIRTWEQLAQALAGPLDASLHQILSEHRDRLQEFAHYDLRELCCFVIVEPGDQMNAVEAVRGFPIGTEPEYEIVHDNCTETVWIVSDDGFGWVLLKPD
ncbi:hypothetical protein ASE00_07455 [Sphingomonas sp. Root710]|uniref:hypothetical protein n=1 Tax=Sphingomonas sp. Root710 TaxID=1736594 RepID=UPI0006FF2011|nr:hypothetical protein [Sphingomonas sp. Root710]KRB86527.1 hypothetical protein ASE00_07455 [Sphingomonas sp. Root710]